MEVLARECVAWFEVEHVAVVVVAVVNVMLDELDELDEHSCSSPMIVVAVLSLPPLDTMT